MRAWAVRIGRMISSCGMTVDVATARWTTERDGQTWYFCSAGCQHRFEKQAANEQA